MVGYTIALYIIVFCVFWLIRVAVEWGVTAALRRERAFIWAHDRKERP